ncbi:Dom-3 Z [Phytophthora pseudosyringae]|uniref:Decapping nuclease n=1 Tax=Phytophthora pseudosyringae TaxID=221518 RepID=A0A8T1V5Y4_9STRA|nr:Dom-3 Z [Phytophthora pseudosyringae]
MTEKRQRDDGDANRHRQRRPGRPYSAGHEREDASSSTARGSLRFAVPRVHELSRQGRVSLSKPQEIAYFSKYADDEVRFDRSNLLVYKKAEVGANLLDGFEEYTSKDETNPTAPPAPIAPLLAALEHFQGETGAREQPHFVTYRNNLNKIMGTPYNSKNDWAFEVEKRDGCVYLDVRRTQQDIESNRNPHENQRRGAFAGRRFEIYSTHPKMGSSGGKQRQVNEDEEFCSISAMALGDKRLVVAAEIDCYEDKGDDSSHAGRDYIELKTFRLLQREKDQFVFERFKLLAFWIQSFLVGTPKIVCAFRSEDFEVRKLQSFRVTEIPNFCRKHWLTPRLPLTSQSPVVCLNFTKALLDWIYEHAQEGRVYRVTYMPRQHAVEMDLSPEPSFLPELIADRALTQLK